MGDLLAGQIDDMTKQAADRRPQDMQNAQLLLGPG